MKPFVVGFIFARGGSEGIPRKNIRTVGGKPLIAYAIETALESELIDRVVVSTDDAEIADVARHYGAEVPFLRPPELARSDSPERLAWQHALRTLDATGVSPKVDVFVCIPTTAPLRTTADVDACIRTLQESDADMVITVRPAERSPYYNMVVLDEAGYARLVIPPDQSLHRRQDVPPVYDMTTVAYAARPDYVLRTDYIFDGKIKAVIVPSERGIDIDTEQDLQIANFLLNRTCGTKQTPLASR
ncbi:MAG: acylneuraminate cytidylyltransferase family protein [Candidatus Omnitrophica bacterium]|nr:acylneuraminate cytidylyltransferase family protein [Candidatus Omnitrophota bacterium]